MTLYELRYLTFNFSPLTWPVRLFCSDNNWFDICDFNALPYVPAGSSVTPGDYSVLLQSDGTWLSGSSFAGLSSSYNTLCKMPNFAVTTNVVIMPTQLPVTTTELDSSTTKADLDTTSNVLTTTANTMETTADVMETTADVFETSAFVLGTIADVMGTTTDVMETSPTFENISMNVTTETSETSRLDLETTESADTTYRNDRTTQGFPSTDPETTTEAVQNTTNLYETGNSSMSDNSALRCNTTNQEIQPASSIVTSVEPPIAVAPGGKWEKLLHIPFARCPKCGTHSGNVILP